MTYKPPAIPDISDKSILAVLESIKEIIEVREGRRGPDPANDRFMSLTLLAGQVGGVTGWFDDGANFRVTVRNGAITAIGASSSAGFSIT